MTDERPPIPRLDGTPLENAKTILTSQAEEPYGNFGGNHAFAALKALVEDIESQRKPEHIWVNAMACINPSEMFLQGLGTTVHKFLLDGLTAKNNPSQLPPWREVTIRVVAS